MGNKYNVREITPEESRCFAAHCPAIYEDKIKDSYWIIGKKVDTKTLPKEISFLEKKVGEDEVLISVPKEIIDNMKR